VPVSGIEFSTAMVDQLRSKPGAGAINVTIGDMATTRVEGAFRLVYLVYNTIGNLTTQDQQVACFANAAAHLEQTRDIGAFVEEALETAGSAARVCVLPEGPQTTTTSPFFTSVEQSVRTWNDPYHLLMFLMEIMVGVSYPSTG